MQLYGKTITKFLQIKELARGHFIQFFFGTDKVHQTDFNQLGLSQRYYENDDVGGSRPKCLVIATLDSVTNKAIPHDYWVNLKCNIQGTVTIITHLNDYEVELWIDENGRNKGFTGDQWHHLYQELNIQKGFILIFQHWFEGPFFELKVYFPDGQLFPFEPVDRRRIMGHRHILFDNRLGDYQGDYKDVVSYDIHASSIFKISNTETDIAESSNTQESYRKQKIFNKKMGKSVMLKSALTILASFVRDHYLYNYALAEITFRGKTTTMPLKVYKDDRVDPEKESSHLVIRGDWEGFMKHNKLKKNCVLVFHFEDATPLNSGKVIFTVTS